MAIERSAAVQEACERARAALQRRDLSRALRHYEYARRLAPDDAEIALAIAAALLGQQDARAAAAFAAVAARHDVQEAWQGLAAAHRARHEYDLAANDLQVLLSRHGYMRGTDNIHLHDAVAVAQRSIGWAALSADGRLRVSLADPRADMHRVVILLDGSPIGIRPQRCRSEGGWSRAIYPLPKDWRRTARIGVSLDGQHLLGSPLEASLIGQVEGFVSAREGALTGWAWYPRDPDCAPALTVCDAHGRVLRIVASDAAVVAADPLPLARPRRLFVPASDLRSLGTPLSVRDAGGRHLYGSPLDPLADQRSAAGAAELARRLFPAFVTLSLATIDLPLPAVPADIVGSRLVAKQMPRASGVDVVIPVHNGTELTMACLDSVLATLPADARCIVIDDASSEPRLLAVLQDLALRRRIVLRQNQRNMGFPASANAGIRAAGGRDVVLLNSDTLVPPGWIERLAEAAYGASDIGTVTPLSNDATIFSYPLEGRASPMPDLAGTTRLDRLAHRANGGQLVEVPTAHGFCVYLRRDCLNEVGLLREDVFAQGYGEENDYSIRARHLGWRHVAAPGVFVAHAGAGSFGGAKAQLLARNLAILNRLHPGYDALIVAFRADDPLAQARFRIDALRWRQRRCRKGSVLLITHARDGGVKRHVSERCAVIVASGLRPIVLSPDARHCRLDDASGEAFPNLRFDTSRGLAELVAFLCDDKPLRVELHHFIGHDPAILGLADALNVPYDAVMHDYAWICPRITLVGVDRRYCGEPGGEACEACYVDIGGELEEDIGPSRLRLRTQRVFAGARRVVVPSDDVATRLQRYFPDVHCSVRPWEAAEPAAPLAVHRVSRLRLRVVVVGAIGIAKGYEYLLACARHVAAHRLALEFVVVGTTWDDKRLWDTGAVQITGPYGEAEAVELIRAQQAEFGFLPALWPETWSYTLSQMWQAGLDVMAFDLGTPAERIRAARRGRLLPLGLPPPATCQALLAWRGNEAPRALSAQAVVVA